jgi:hypothetical protein
VVLCVAVWLARGVRLHTLTEAERTYLLVGSALLVSCFVLAQNVSYRATHLLFVLPALVVSCRGAAWLVVLLMWSSGLRRLIYGTGALPFGIWLAHELAWWAVITLLATLLLRLMREAPAVAALFPSTTTNKRFLAARRVLRE